MAISGKFVYRDYMDWLINLTICVLLICAIAIGLKQYVGTPMKCNVPDDFSKRSEQYANEHCFMAKNYYALDANQTWNSSAQKEPAYYPWAPYLLVCAAFWLWVPGLLWKAWSSRSGASVTTVLKSAEVVHSGYIDKERRQELIEQLSAYIDTNFGRNFCRTLVFFITKILTLIIIFIQFGSLSFLMGNTEKIEYYFQWDYNSIEHFPLLIICDYQVFSQGVMESEPIQCAVSINELNRKIFAAFQGWYSALIVFQILNLIYWICIILCPCFRGSLRDYSKSGSLKYQRGCDAYLVLRLVGDHVSELVAGQLTTVGQSEGSEPPSPPPPPPPAAAASEPDRVPLIEQARRVERQANDRIQRHGSSRSATIGPRGMQPYWEPSSTLPMPRKEVKKRAAAPYRRIGQSQSLQPWASSSIVTNEQRESWLGGYPSPIKL